MVSRENALENALVGVPSRNSERIVWPDKLDSDFMRNVINAFPHDAYTLAALVSVFVFKYGNVSTAEIHMIGRPAIIIGRKWAEKWVHTWADMASVIYHEIMHKILLHAKEDMSAQTGFALDFDQASFLFDIKVQGISYQTMRHPSYQDIWRRYYGDQGFPTNLLYSGSILDTYTHRALHSAIYSPFGVEPDRLARIIFEQLSDTSVNGGNGSSDQSSAERQSGDSKENVGQDSGLDPEDNDLDRPLVGSHGDNDEEDSRMAPMEVTLKYASDLADKIRREEELEKRRMREEAIAKEALKRKSGARGLRAIMESSMIDIMYEIPSLDNVKECVIGEDVVLNKEDPILLFEQTKKQA